MRCIQQNHLIRIALVTNLRLKNWYSMWLWVVTVWVIGHINKLVARWPSTYVILSLWNHDALSHTLLSPYFCISEWSFNFGIETGGIWMKWIIRICRLFIQNNPKGTLLQISDLSSSSSTTSYIGIVTSFFSSVSDCMPISEPHSFTK